MHIVLKLILTLFIMVIFGILAIFTYATMVGSIFGSALDKVFDTVKNTAKVIDNVKNADKEVDKEVDKEAYTQLTQNVEYPKPIDPYIPVLGYIEGKSQEPYCGVVWDNIDVNYEG
jgi:hypothetical protein